MNASQYHRWITTVWVLMMVFPLMATAGPDHLAPGAPMERILWQKTPITVPLTVGEERLVHFAGSVSVGVPQTLVGSLRSQSINGTIYLMAHQPFEATRVLVRSEHAGPIYALDLSAQAPDPQRPPLPELQILVPDSAQDNLVADSTQIPTPRWGYVALTRYAAQQLYAPARLLFQVPGIARVPVAPAAMDLVRGGQVDAVPIAAWRAGLHTVTAVRLSNSTPEPIILDPRQLRGTWLAATFQHNRLLPAGSDADATAVYLISDRPFEVSF